ncbi:hypothetical protein, partial [Megasphaera sp.]|uniref:hypothetical protein n=1 Tax=Megasphaera sp. TaxID=2023260 RepID=UPI00258F8C83
HLRSSPSNAWPDNGCLPAASTGKSAFGQQLLDDFTPGFHPASQPIAGLCHEIPNITTSIQHCSVFVGDNYTSV